MPARAKAREHDPKRKAREHDPKRKAREYDPKTKAREQNPKRKTREQNAKRKAREQNPKRKQKKEGCGPHTHQTGLRMKPVIAVVSAPPARWRWCAPRTDEPEPTDAKPEWNLWSKKSFWRYSSSESDQIWCSSKPFRGTASV